MNENEKKVNINEEALEEVAGGTVKGVCFFEPADPLSMKDVDGFTAVKCKMNCHPFGAVCCCHGTFRCSGKYHRVESLESFWVAFPALENNHGAPEKRIPK